MCNCKIQLDGKDDPLKFNCECTGSDKWDDYGYRTTFKIVFPNRNREFVKAITPDLTPHIQGSISNYVEKVKQAFSEKPSTIIFIDSDFGYYLSLFDLIKDGYITVKDYQEFLKAHKLVDLFFNYQKIKDKKYDKDVLRVKKKSLFRKYQFKTYDEYTDMLDQLNNFTRRKHYTNFIDFFGLNSFKQNIGNKLFFNGNIYLWDEFIQKLTWPKWKTAELYLMIIDYLLDNNNRTELIDNWPVVDVLYLRQKNNADIAEKIKCLFPEELIDIVNDIYKIKDNLRVNPDILQGDCETAK